MFFYFSKLRAQPIAIKIYYFYNIIWRTYIIRRQMFLIHTLTKAKITFENITLSRKVVIQVTIKAV